MAPATVPDTTPAAPVHAAAAHLDGPEKNLLLAGLGPGHYAALTAASELVRLERGATLIAPNVLPEAVFFPQDCVASLVGATVGGMVEVATIGREGMVGLPILLGGEPMPSRTFVQVPGVARRIQVAAFRRLIADDAALRERLLRYVQALFAQVSQSVACNRLHSLEERCARWLLMTHDRVGRDEFSLTHEFLAEMLGVRRPSVSIAARTLQDAGGIRYRRGRVAILNRRRLEQAACECYGVVHRQYVKLLGGATVHQER